mmetsp:Transcript_10015/g.34900  ORF Transcript_10015/g.34900 Transcript_10015/m.34900 type:complete len:783 (+) Transcript_10015:211-2559(+)
MHLENALADTLWKEIINSYPANECVIDEQSQFSYMHINNLGSKVLQYLCSLHANTISHNIDHVSAVYMDRCQYFFACVCGILRSGHAYVPLNIHDAQKRIGAVLAVVQPLVIFTKCFCALECDSTKIDVLDLFENEHTLQPVFHCPTLKGADLCYIIFTSGTTGQPKGVMIEHHSAHNMISETLDFFQFSVHDRVLQFYNLAFDGSLWQYLSAFSAGSSLVLWRPPLTNLIEAIINHKVTILMCTASVLAILDPSLFQTLRYVVQGGEATTVEMVSKWVTPECPFVDAYGPTEATVFITLQKYLTAPQLVTLGLPAKNCSIHVLNDHYEQVNVGSEGQIYIGGCQLARGYFKDTEKTREKFIQHNELGRVYATGDYARVVRRGEIQILGRMDHQVKINGYRVELGEIAAILQQYSGVLCVAMKFTEGEIVAYVCWKQHPDSREKQTFLEHQAVLYCNTKLPSYMIPARIVSLKKMPMTSTGKINYAELPPKSSGSLSVKENHITSSSIPDQSYMESALQLITQGIGKRVDANTVIQAFNSVQMITVCQTISKFSHADMRAVYSMATRSKTVGELMASTMENVTPDDSPSEDNGTKPQKRGLNIEFIQSPSVSQVDEFISSWQHIPLYAFNLIGEPLPTKIQLGKYRKHRIEQADGYYIFSILKRDDHEFLGLASITMERYRVGVLGIAFKPAAKHSYGVECLVNLLDVAFVILNVRKVKGEVYSTNLNSKALWECVGGSCDGCLREEAIYEGLPVDKFQYSILASEWKERSSSFDWCRKLST